MAGRSHVRRILVLALTAPLVFVSLVGCKEVETTKAAGYQPATVEETGDGGVVVTFTQEGADRLGLQTEIVRRQGDDVVVPYAALIYDPTGGTWVYRADDGLTYQRVEVVVDRADGDQAYVSEGIDAGVDVVTTGSTEVYGTELGMDGSH